MIWVRSDLVSDFCFEVGDEVGVFEVCGHIQMYNQP